MTPEDQAMIKAHWTVFIESCITQGILVVLYLATLVRMCVTVRLDFVFAIAILLMVSCITWPCECYLQFHQIKDTADGLNE